MIRQHPFLSMIVFFAGVAAWAVAQPGDAELDQNRNRVIAMRKKQPEQLARLHENLKAFLSLSEPHRSAIVKFDEEVQKLSPKKQERLLNALERYADWLDQLREKEPQAYRAIKDAPNDSARLALIKDRRDREWMELQPKAHRQQWEKLTGPAQTEFVVKLREEERRKQEQWLIAKRFWRELESKQAMPTRLSEFTPKVRDYVTDYLLPYVTEAEKKALQEAEGHWPDYPRTLVAIAAKRPSALPPPQDLPVHFSQLPAPIQARVSEKKGGLKKKITPELKKFDGRPEFVNKVVEIGTSKGFRPFDHEYWASYLHSLQPPMQEFVKKQLMPRLDTKDQKDLQSFEGSWPYYPQAIRDLSRKHGLTPPWHILPEPERWRWDAYRSSQARSWGADLAKEKDKKTP